MVSCLFFQPYEEIIWKKEYVIRGSILMHMYVGIK